MTIQSLEIIKCTFANIRYISGGRDVQLERFTIPIKFVMAEKKVIPNAASNIPSPLCTIFKTFDNT